MPYQAWDFTVASAKSLAGPALTMHKLAYQWLAANSHVRINRGASTCAAYTVTSSTDTDGVRDIHGTFQVPLFLGDTTPLLKMVTDSAGNPKINGSKTWTANFICVMPTTMQPGGPATPTVYGHGLLGTRPRSRAARSRRASPTT